MTYRVFGCGKFRRLSSERIDRSLAELEVRFMDRHRAVCGECGQAEEDGNRALKMLRLAILEPKSSPSFDARLLRRARVDSVRAEFSYWSPALFGAAIAGIAILAALQMISDSSRLPAFRVPGGAEPQLTRNSPAFPRLDAPEALSQPPR